MQFAQDAEGNWGYVPVGADAVIPFRRVAYGKATLSKDVWTQLEFGFRPTVFIACRIVPSGSNTQIMEMLYDAQSDNPFSIGWTANTNHAFASSSNMATYLELTDTGVKINPNLGGPYMYAAY